MNVNGSTYSLAFFWQGAGSDNTLRVARSAETKLVVPGGAVGGKTVGGLAGPFEGELLRASWNQFGSVMRKARRAAAIRARNLAAMG